MEKSIKTIGTIGAMTILLCGAYLLGTTQAKTVTKIIEDVSDSYIDTTSEDFYNNYVDMRQVNNYTTNGDSLQLYLSDGSIYYWER